MKNKWLTQQTTSKYKLGIGDTLDLRFIKEDTTVRQMTSAGDNENQNLIINSEKIDNTINSRGRIGSDGSDFF